MTTPLTTKHLIPLYLSEYNITVELLAFDKYKRSKLLSVKMKNLSLDHVVFK